MAANEFVKNSRYHQSRGMQVYEVYEDEVYMHYLIKKTARITLSVNRHTRTCAQHTGWSAMTIVFVMARAVHYP